jgi:hypothetical protein
MGRSMNVVVVVAVVVIAIPAAASLIVGTVECIIICTTGGP